MKLKMVNTSLGPTDVLGPPKKKTASTIAQFAVESKMTKAEVRAQALIHTGMQLTGDRI